MSGLIHAGGATRGIRGWCPRRFAVVLHDDCVYAGSQRGDHAAWGNPRGLEGASDFDLPTTWPESREIAEAIVEAFREEILRNAFDDIQAGFVKALGITDHGDDVQVLAVPTPESTQTLIDSTFLAAMAAAKASAEKGRMMHAMQVAWFALTDACPEQWSADLKLTGPEGRVGHITTGPVPRATA